MTAAYRHKTALVTGAGSGIGRALCEALARRGARVIATDLDAAAARRTAQEISQQGGLAQAFPLDVRDEGAFHRLAARVQAQHGGLDYLFNNAGIAVAGEVKDCTTEDFKNVLDVNLMGVIHGVQAVYPLMIRQGRGHVVNTASLSGFVPLAGAAAYAASKFGVLGLSLALRVEAARYGVKVSALCPGIIDTPIYDNAAQRGFSAHALRENLWVRAPTPAECARLALRAVARNEAVILVPESARLLALAQRLFPDLTLWAMSRVFEKSRAG